MMERKIAELIDYGGLQKNVRFEERLTCTVAEACSAIGLSRAKVYKLISGGVVESVRVGRRRLVKVESLKRLTDTSHH